MAHAAHSPPTDATGVLSIAAEIVSERRSQDVKWGEPHDAADGTGQGELFMAVPFAELRDDMQSRVDRAAYRNESRMSWVLLEEVFEALAESDDQKLRAELIQVAAVAAK